MTKDKQNFSTTLSRYSVVVSTSNSGAALLGKQFKNLDLCKHVHTTHIIAVPFYLSLLGALKLAIATIILRFHFLLKSNTFFSVAFMITSIAYAKFSAPN